MRPYIAVFNGHINRADKTARKVMAKFFPENLKEVLDLEKEGKGDYVYISN